MLLIPVRIGPSDIHGLGVFSVHDIPEGTVVWRFTPGFDLDQDPRLLDEQAPHSRKVLLHYGHIDPVLDRFILCCDDCRFMNHSDRPNIRIDRDADRYGVAVAAYDIKADEELTVNYDIYDGI